MHRLLYQINAMQTGRLRSSQRTWGTRKTHRYIASNVIFYPAEMKSNLREIEQVLWSAVTAKEIGKESEDHELQNQGWAKVKGQAEGLRDKIERDIRARLESHMRAAIKENV